MTAGVLGVDESNNNPVPNPAAHARQLLADGVRFVYLKASEGETFTDSTYVARHAAYRAAGLYVGGYHFAHPDADPSAQALHFLRVLGQLHPGDLPPALDLEIPEGRTTAELVTFTRSFLAVVRGHTGRRPVLYTSASYLHDHLSGGVNIVPDYALLWLAAWGPAEPTTPHVLWQSSDRGELHGVPFAVDLDRMNGTGAQLANLAGIRTRLPARHVEQLRCPPTVKPGDHNGFVRRVQGLLFAVGQHPGAIDGIDGPATAAAVRRVQALAHLPVTGRVDPATWRVLLGVA